jgi:FkbM family methyltransferase
VSLGRRVVNAIRRRWRARVLAGWGEGRTWRRASPGFWMQLSRDDFDDVGFFFGGWDDAFVRDVPALVLPGELAIDIGAQKGFFAMILARAVGRAGAVLAIEADPAALELLASHRDRNGLGAIRIAAGAVGDREGEEIAFHLSDQVGWSSRFPNAMQAPHVRRALTLRTRTVDSVAAERLADLTSPLSLVKIDVEGSEVRVLRGMRTLLREHSPTLWMEVNHASLTAAGTSADDLETLLQPFAYRFYLPDYEPALFGGPRVWYTPVAHLRDVARAEFDIIAVAPAYAGRARRMAEIVGAAASSR